jgi:hypothetical protein
VTANLYDRVAADCDRHPADLYDEWLAERVRPFSRWWRVYSPWADKPLIVSTAAMLSPRWMRGELLNQSGVVAPAKLCKVWPELLRLLQAVPREPTRLLDARWADYAANQITLKLTGDIKITCDLSVAANPVRLAMAIWESHRTRVLWPEEGLLRQLFGRLGENYHARCAG